jgi:hypothetical protein
MKAAELYAKTLEGYTSVLPFLKVSLANYCKYRKVNYRGLCHWMGENMLPVPCSKQPVNPELPLPPFAPVTILAPSSAVVKSSVPSSAGMLKGVKIKWSNGLHVSIREISVKDLSSLIDKINLR